MPIRLLMIGVVACGVFALAGCGGGSIGIEGKVVNGSKAYSPSTDGDVNIGLTADTGGKSFSSKAEEDGTFKIAGVPPGKYSVSVTRYPKADEKSTKVAPPPTNKKLDEKWDVSSSNKSFTLDISKLK
jgi:hypothetical protein